MRSISEELLVPTDPGVRNYRREESVVFYKTRERFGGLSNMASGFPLVVNGINILTSEALYQACRFPRLPEVQELIIQQSSPMTAKMKSKRYREKTRSDWDFVRVAVMKWCIKVKLTEHWDEFGKLLLSTGQKPIVEQSRNDRFWGAIPEPDEKVLNGRNVLGRLLMDLRERAIRDPSEFEVIPPIPIRDFLLLGHPIEPILRRTGERSLARIERAKLRAG